MSDLPQWEHATLVVANMGDRPSTIELVSASDSVTISSDGAGLRTVMNVLDRAWEMDGWEVIGGPLLFIQKPGQMMVTHYLLRRARK